MHRISTVTVLLKPLPVAVGVIQNNQAQVLISKRDNSLHQGGLWEFPGGKIESDETPYTALVRELFEELDIVVRAATPLITVHHAYPDVTVQLHVYLISKFSGLPKSCLGQKLKWVSVKDLNKYSFPAADKAIISAASLPPFYAILNAAPEDLLLSNLKKILAQNIKLIQARLKNLSRKELECFINKAYPLCEQQGALLLLNSVSFARLESENVAVHGIHLTSQDLMATGKRPKLQLVGASCHNLQELQHAEAIGVDFAVLAPVLLTQTHPDTKPLGWLQFSTWVSQVNLPVYALGGLTVTDLSTAQHCGGQGIAAIRAFLE